MGYDDGDEATLILPIASRNTLSSSLVCMVGPTVCGNSLCQLPVPVFSPPQTRVVGYGLARVAERRVWSQGKRNVG